MADHAIKIPARCRRDTGVIGMPYHTEGQP
jgi:hypothetical protein